MEKLPPKRLRGYAERGPECRALHAARISNLSDYFAALDSALRKGARLWFRGHSDYTWELAPSALRYPNRQDRDRALQLLDEFKRYAELKLPKPPSPNEHLKWTQLAQHYGLPTRLLDWTENSAIALYFACNEYHEEDGTVFVLDPIILNRLHDPKRPRVLDAHRDAPTISQYLSFTGKLDPRARPPIAIHPIWNTDRIILQQGVFTLHGGLAALTSEHVFSLVAIPILHEHKEALLQQLERIGVHEMAIFPEVEHTCAFLKRRAALG